MTTRSDQQLDDAVFVLGNTGHREPGFCPAKTMTRLWAEQLIETHPEWPGLVQLTRKGRARYEVLAANR